MFLKRNRRKIFALYIKSNKSSQKFQPSLYKNPSLQHTIDLNNRFIGHRDIRANLEFAIEIRAHYSET